MSLFNFQAIYVIRAVKSGHFKMCACVIACQCLMCGGNHVKKVEGSRSFILS